MIGIGINCDRGGCQDRFKVMVGSNEFFGNKSLNKYLPNGWKIRTPKDFEFALTFCPLHANEKPDMCYPIAREASR